MRARPPAVRVANKQRSLKSSCVRLFKTSVCAIGRTRDRYQGSQTSSLRGNGSSSSVTATSGMGVTLMRVLRSCKKGTTRRIGRRRSKRTSRATAGIRKHWRPLVGTSFDSGNAKSSSKSQAWSNAFAMRTRLNPAGMQQIVERVHRARPVQVPQLRRARPQSGRCSHLMEALGRPTALAWNRRRERMNALVPGQRRELGQSAQHRQGSERRRLEPWSERRQAGHAIGSSTIGLRSLSHRRFAPRGLKRSQRPPPDQAAPGEA